MDGSTEKGVDPDGKDVMVSYRAEGDVLYARYVGEDGEKRIAFELGPEGEELTVHVTVLSEKLDKPIRYSLPYTRE